VPSPSPETIQQKKAEVFSRKEFQPTETADSELLKAFTEFFRWLGSLYDGARWLFWLLVIGCVVLLLAILVHMIFTVRRVVGAVRGRPRDDAERAARILLSARYRNDAARLVAAGDYTEAVRFLFLSLVYRYDEQGRISLHKAYTNREYLSLLPERRDVRDALRVMVDTLDDHWYGQRPCDQHRYEECHEIYERLVAAV
jgi:hypothetical protein